MHLITKVEFAPHEKDALTIIANINCEDIHDCVSCPFFVNVNDKYKTSCIKKMIDKITKGESFE